jgi:cytochrome P450
VTLRRDRKAFHKFIGSVVNERRTEAEKLGSDYKKPVETSSNSAYFQNDLLQWLMDAAQGSDASTEQLALRTLVLNFASIHTTSVVRFKNEAHFNLTL